MVLLLGVGCSQEAPEIRQQFVQRNYREDPRINVGYEQLSVFLHVDDEDGYEDLEYLYIIHDKDELFWILDADSWEYRERDGETWIGSNEIVMADFTPFPEGTYRLVVIDKAGERKETEAFLLSPPAPPRLPRITVGDQSLIIEGPIRQYTLWMYRDGSFLGSQNIKAGTINTADLKDEKAEEIYLYYYDEEKGRGIIRGPYTLGR